jgi:hypothetical protein
MGKLANPSSSASHITISSPSARGFAHIEEILIISLAQLDSLQKFFE